MALPDDHHRGVGDRLRSGLRGLRGDGRIGIPPFLEHGLRGSPPEGPGGDRGTGVGNDTRRPRRPGPPPRRRDGRRLCQRAGVGRLDGNGPGQQVARGRGPADRSRQRQGPPRLRLSEPLPEAPPGGGRPRALRRRVPRARRLQRHRGRSRHGRERMAADGEVLAARLPRADPGVSERTKPSDRRALVRARIQRCRHETKQNRTEQNGTGLGAWLCRQPPWCLAFVLPPPRQPCGSACCCCCCWLFVGTNQTQNQGRRDGGAYRRCNTRSLHIVPYQKHRLLVAEWKTSAMPLACRRRRGFLALFHRIANQKKNRSL
mmetsp:Transcript_13621/g.31450  ORF Transcript_13621/g.31450 Transcript_13621/m.31450 type:complete len:317 (+) Transcript_13621:662-1612(+)